MHASCLKTENEAQHLVGVHLNDSIGAHEQARDEASIKTFYATVLDHVYCHILYNLV